MNMLEMRMRRDAAPMFRRDAPGNSFVRIVTAQAIAAVRRASPVEVAADYWPSDRAVAEVLTRAASAPAMTTVTGWAAELAQRVVSDAVEALGGVAAGAEVLRRGLLLSLDGYGSIGVPGLVASATAATFVAEGDPIPVRQLPTTAAVISPYKLATIAVLTREMIESSNAEALIGDALVRSMGLGLDAVLFDANAATSARPPGLKNGIAATTASTSSDLFEAVFEDVTALINAIAPVAGSGPYVVVASPGRAAGMAMRFNPSPVVVLGSAAIGNDIAAIAPAAVAAAMSPAPEVETAKSATLVMDTAPGAAGTTAAVEKGVFQTDSIALKVRLPVTWTLRDPRGFAWLTPTWK